jgi:hypothetical protein
MLRRGLFCALFHLRNPRYMKESSLALLILLFLSLAAYGQSVVRSQQFNSVNIPIALPERAAVHEDTLAARSIVAVKKLEKEVLVYRSLGEFEKNGRIARVSFETFTDSLTKVTAEVEPLSRRRVLVAEDQSTAGRSGLSTHCIKL